MWSGMDYPFLTVGLHPHIVLPLPVRYIQEYLHVPGIKIHMVQADYMYRYIFRSEYVQYNHHDNRSILYADEPTGNIDPEMSYEIVDLLNHINANGTTVVMVTHEHNLVRHFHHRVITIEQGAVVSDSEDTEALPDDYATIERDYASDASNAERAAAAAAAVQNIASSETVEDRVAKQKEDSISPFYVQPNSDADLEKFMATYGVDSDSSDDDVDYSKYLDAIEKKTGGDNR